MVLPSSLETEPYLIIGLGRGNVPNFPAEWSSLVASSDYRSKHRPISSNESGGGNVRPLVPTSRQFYTRTTLLDRRKWKMYANSSFVSGAEKFYAFLNGRREHVSFVAPFVFIKRDRDVFHWFDRGSARDSKIENYPTILRTMILYCSIIILLIEHSIICRISNFLELLTRNSSNSSKIKFGNNGYIYIMQG